MQARPNDLPGHCLDPRACSNDASVYRGDPASCAVTENARENGLPFHFPSRLGVTPEPWHLFPAGNAPCLTAPARVRRP
ncbi:MAG: hypothetical protein V4710_17325 [Verrucomicrobiota bacterium]